jgi:putative nucleotidyltransferase with HDIG domain
MEVKKRAEMMPQAAPPDSPKEQKERNQDQEHTGLVVEETPAILGGFDYSKIQPEPVDGFFSPMREWKRLQNQIRTHAALVAKNEWDVLEGLNTYRMVLSGVSFKPLKVDQEIWDIYSSLRYEVPVLTKKTIRRGLMFHRVKQLRKYELDWTEILQKQQKLLDLLAKAPKSVEFYNRIHLARIKKREQELRDAEIARRNAQAREAIEKALSQFGQTDLRGIGAPGASILKIDDAKIYWSERLQEIINLETTTKTDPDELIAVFKNLEHIIVDAPSMAEKVREIEVQFIRLMSMQEELSAFGKNVIPSEELARMLMVFQDDVPKLWATGSWEKLRKALNELANFVKFYELPVRSEMSLAERRKPALTRALLMGANNLPLNQAAPLIRSLVSAIDARDRYMRGHSDTVARLVVHVAKRMEWRGEDLEMLEVAALLHDVGKIVIPENVLTKLDPLTAEEWKTIQMHPYHGARIVKSLETLNRTIPWIYHHQERWDGAGYPDGLSKASIPLAARIIALGEAYTVMTTDQPKRKALSMDEAIDEIQEAAGTQFDPEIVEAFVDVVPNLKPEPKLERQTGIFPSAITEL